MSARIGILDTAIHPDHPKLGCRTASFHVLGKPRSARDSHGNTTTTIILDDALYPELPRLPQQPCVSVVSVARRGQSVLNLLTGMDILLGQGVNVVCLPFGFRLQTKVFFPMIRAFVERDVLVVVPIGNGGQYAANVPGVYPGVLTVGALARDGCVAAYSGRMCDDRGACFKPELLAAISSRAPFDQVEPDGTDGTPRAPPVGTSLACAYVSGVAARLMVAHPRASGTQVRRALRASARPPNAEQRLRCRDGVLHPERAQTFLERQLPGSFAEEEYVPEFLRWPYVDRQFLVQLKYAKAHTRVEAIVAPGHSLADCGDPGGLGLRPFRHADLVHVSATPTFFRTLVQTGHTDIISACAVNMFEV